MDDATMDGRIAMVTGAGSGIGRATAIAFAKAGAQVGVVDLNADAARATLDVLRSLGSNGIAVAVDVGEAEQVEHGIGEIVSRFGRLDYAFNNAGVHGSQLGVAAKKLGDIDEAAMQGMVRVNLKGVWLCMKYQLRHMAQQRSGAIVNSASVGGVIGLQGSSIYCACKHGVLGLTKVAAVEFSESNIRVNAVSPGYTDTPMMAESMQRKGDLVLASIPMHRLARPEDIAATVTFLCSDAASYITGSNYMVDGGFLAGR